ncbi:hypothetical protein, partial [Lysobacter sp. TAB13]|uniref:hypothetical protein n=1 Tax=Lysobacter sp. TAB13 TaxID=3233065 RepID=UPI003F9459D6
LTVPFSIGRLGTSQRASMGLSLGASLHEDNLNGALMIDRLTLICDQIDEIVEKVSDSERDLGWEAQRDLSQETAKLLEDHMAMALRELMQIKADQRKAKADGHTLH